MGKIAEEVEDVDEHVNEVKAGKDALAEEL